MIFDRDGGSHLCNPVYPTERTLRLMLIVVCKGKKEYPTGYRAKLHDGAWVNVPRSRIAYKSPWSLS